MNYENQHCGTRTCDRDVGFKMHLTGAQRSPNHKMECVRFNNFKFIKEFKFIISLHLEPEVVVVRQGFSTSLTSGRTFRTLLSTYR